MIRTNLLEVKDLCTYFHTIRGIVPAVDGVSFSLNSGGSLGLVGESGCGKSVTSLSILKLIAEPPGRITGEIIHNGYNILLKSNKELRKIRGKDISMIFQEPMSSLNPLHTVGRQIMESIIIHQKASSADARNRTIEILEHVGFPSPKIRIGYFPHQLSGGMRQRVMIAMALSCNPKLLIADEPTTALDVTIQAQILNLIQKLREDTGMALMLISHDLGIIAEMTEEVAIMYCGKIVELARTTDLFRRPLHPYTKGLIGCIPRSYTTADKKLTAIPGVVPSPYELPSGCRFSNRCSYAKAQCSMKEPQLEEKEDGHSVSCFYADEI